MLCCTKRLRLRFGYAVGVVALRYCAVVPFGDITYIGTDRHIRGGQLHSNSVFGSVYPVSVINITDLPKGQRNAFAVSGVFTSLPTQKSTRRARGNVCLNGTRRRSTDPQRSAAGSSRDEICWRQLTADSALVDEFDATCPAAAWTAVVGLICTRSYLR